MNPKIFLIFSIFLLISVATASTIDCKISQTNDAGNSDFQAIIRMQNYTNGFENAHAQQYNSSTNLYNYAYTLYCKLNETGYIIDTSTCNEQKPLYLSNTTNAHVSVSRTDTYSIPVCLSPLPNGTMSCTIRSPTCLTTETSLISIYSQTNAHVGNYTYYNYVMCCSFELPSLPAPPAGRTEGMNKSLDLWDLFIDKISGSWNIFIFLSFILISFIMAKMRVPNIVTIALYILYALIMGVFFPTLMTLALIIVGIGISIALHRFLNED